MNRYHRWYCRSDRWARRLQGTILPGVLKGVELGDNLLEIGPGPGVATDWLRSRAALVTAIEIDSRLAQGLRDRFHATNVTVVEGDATSMPFPDASFSGAVAFTMLHHVPYAVQDRLFAEAARVLRPGAMFAGMDSTPSFSWNLHHLFDDRNPVDPTTLEDRLRAAGFAQASVRTGNGGFTFRAMKGE
ncbi:MAG: class I SAM-dependent methyltransferase [Dehalococcoidia bacterium]